jgi:hypothetical protein
MRRLVMLVLLPACATVSPEQIRAELRQQTEPTISCPQNAIEIGEYQGGMTAAGAPVLTYPASGCGREYICEASQRTIRATCTETAESEARAVKKLVVDRLALETGCAPANIAIVQEAEWVRGQERAFRLEACGKAYVCTTVPGHATSCKAALAYSDK